MTTFLACYVASSALEYKYERIPNVYMIMVLISTLNTTVKNPHLQSDNMYKSVYY